MSEFLIGDVVVLKSGGPTMTVESASGEFHATCVWYDKNNTIQKYHFSKATLRPAMTRTGKPILDLDR